MRYWSRVTKEEKSALRGEWENAINGKQSDSVQQETLADSVTEKHRKTGAVADKRDNRPLLRQKRGHRLTDKSSKGSGLREKRSSGIKGPRGCTNLLRGKCTNPSCFFFFRTLPCAKITRLNRDANVATIVSLDALRLTGSQVKSRRTVVEQDQLAQ